jgi:uncharacterized membrane protein YphA (DoxX/SURF4 family)
MKFLKYLPAIAGVLLGLQFIMAGVLVLLNKVPEQEIVEGTPVAHFMAAFGPTGYMTFIKVFELLGGVLVMIPKLRNLGLLVLGPILVNILAYHAFVMDGEGLFSPMLLFIVALALYLLWSGRKQFAGLIRAGHQNQKTEQP